MQLLPFQWFLCGDNFESFFFVLLLMLLRLFLFSFGSFHFLFFVFNLKFSPRDFEKRCYKIDCWVYLKLHRFSNYCEMVVLCTVYTQEGTHERASSQNCIIQRRKKQKIREEKRAGKRERELTLAKQYINKRGKNAFKMCVHMKFNNNFKITTNSC